MAREVKIQKAVAVLRSGKKVTIPAWVVESGKPGPCFLLTAAQHGNEVNGSEAMRRFIEIVREEIRAGKVIAVPFANLPAVRERRPHIKLKPEQPYGLDHGHNMNRTWPGKQRGNDTERVTYALHVAFAVEATHVLDLHSWSRFSAPGVLIRDRADLRELAGKLGHRFVHVRPPYDFTLGGLFNSSGRVGVSYEFAGQYAVVEEEVQRGLRVILNMAKAIGILPGRLIPGDKPVLFLDQTESVTVKAPCSGLFVESGLRLCAPVKKGELLGHIISDKNLATREIFAPASGFLRVYGAHRPNCDVALPAQHPYVTRGDTLAVITWPKGGMGC